MEEPSVLDYIKAKLAFWKHSSLVLPPPAPQAGAGWRPEAEDEDGNVAIRPQAAEPKPAAPAPQARTASGGLLRVAGALGFALVAQGFLEPPNRAVVAAAVLYAVAAVLIGSAYYRNLMQPARIPEEETAPDSLAFRQEGLALGLALMVLTFLTFGTRAGQDVPRFEFINTALWLLSIGYLVWAFYLPRGGGLSALRDRVGRFMRQPAWRLTVTRWGLLLLLVSGVIVFFRFYRLNGLPPEMVSDHAEKLLDVSDVLAGQLRVFFPRNTGREAFQFYWTALMVKLFDTGVSFMALKLGTTLIGLLTLYYLYRLGLEIANRWAALFAVLFAGFSYWANIQSRIGLRFPLYPGFLAPMLFHLVRGLRRSNRNDFIWAGIWLGIGLHGYTSYRIVPLVVVAGIAIYLLHHRAPALRRSVLAGLAVLTLVSLAVFMPLLRFTVDNPQMVAYRSLTRLASEERPLPGSPVQIFFQNTWNAMVMFFWDNGDVWVHSIPHRPALDVIAAALFFLGAVLVALRYLRKRSWVDLFLLVSIPLLLLPSILSLAFPNENPNLNRTAGAYIPVFLILGIGLEGLLRAIKCSLPARPGAMLAGGLGLALVLFSAANNFDLVFNQYERSMRAESWNTSEMGAVIHEFDRSLGSAADAWVVAFPYWVDTRLVSINAGYPTRDMAISTDGIPATTVIPRTKLFLLNPQDQAGLARLRAAYPEGRFWVYKSRTPGKDFVIFLVPPQGNTLPEGAAAGLVPAGALAQP